MDKRLYSKYLFKRPLSGIAYFGQDNPGFVFYTFTPSSKSKRRYLKILTLKSPKSFNFWYLNNVKTLEGFPDFLKIYEALHNLLRMYIMLIKYQSVLHAGITIRAYVIVKYVITIDFLTFSLSALLHYCVVNW